MLDSIDAYAIDFQCANQSNVMQEMCTVEVHMFQGQQHCFGYCGQTVPSDADA